MPLTGNNRNPTPDFGSFVTVNTLAMGTAAGSTNDPTQPIRLTGNAPVVNGVPLFQQLNVPENGIVYTNTLGLTSGFAVPDTGTVPYSQNWNLSFSFEALRNTVVEVAYAGNKGTHLYLPFVNLNPVNTEFVEFLEGRNIASEQTFADPLGRRNLAGGVISIPRNTVQSPFFGFDNLNNFLDPSGNSIRHAGYIDVRRRVSRGLTFTANYTFAKSIDDASDASPDTRVLDYGQTQGQITYGAPRNLDRSLSTFDVKHAFNSTFVWDLPVGRGRGWLLDKGPGVVDAVLGGWTMSGVFRVVGGNPFLPFLTDANRLSGVNRAVRPNVVEGVPIINPLWSRDCPVGATCEPFINPAAFIRPPKGELGNAPRTLDIRGPAQEYFDLSFQKNFKWPFADNDGKRRINFRVDLINAFNHPNFRHQTIGNGGPGLGTVPTEGNLTQAELTNWLAANPGRTVTLAQVNNLIASQRTSTGGLPLDFFSVPVPQGFATRAPESFDITTVEGLRLYRLRQAYNPSFGALGAFNNPRYVQFGIRIFF